MKNKKNKLTKFLEKYLVYIKIGFEFIKSVVSIVTDMYK
jgi:hypothetical protein